MAQHAPLHDGEGDQLISGVSVPSERTLPAQVRAARDELFQDADRHGPRVRELAQRVLGALVIVPLALLLTINDTWRDLIIGNVPVRVADSILLVPLLVALVAAAALLAPLARLAALPLVVASAPLIALGSWLIHEGAFGIAVLPTALGAIVLGLAAARVMRRAVWALPVLLAAGVSDAQSVQQGVTSQLLDDVGRASENAVVEPLLRMPVELVASVDYVVLHIPVATGTWMLGIVDVMALGLLLGLSHLYWLPIMRTAIALAVALSATIVFGTPIAVLPVLGLAWALVHARLIWRSTRFSLRRLLYLGG